MPSLEQVPLLGHMNDDPEGKYSHLKGPLSQIYNYIKSSWLHLLLLFVPLSFVVHFTGAGEVTVFAISFLAIIPLAKNLGDATEQVAMKLGQTLGGLLNATFGNAVELIVAVIALIQGEIRIVQTSMLGSILSNLLLVLGCAFVAGGVHGGEQHFPATSAQAQTSLMTLAGIGLALPAAYRSTALDQGQEPESLLFKEPNGAPNIEKGLLIISRGASVVLLSIYVLFLIFQLRTHAYLFEDNPVDAANARDQHATNVSIPRRNNTRTRPRAGSTTGTSGHVTSSNPEEVIFFTPLVATFVLVIVTLLVAFCSDYLVGSIEGVVKLGIPKSFIGLIIVPIVGNAAEHASAIISSSKGHMALAIGISVGSSLQIALFMTPALVMVGWAIGQPMDLYFRSFEAAALILSCILTNSLLMDGASNYLEGSMLIGTYLIIAIAVFVS